MNILTASLDERMGFRPILYIKRWFILFILAWLNFTNGLLWISYASISDNISCFYNVSSDYVNYLSLVFPLVTIVLGLPVIWGMDRMGLRFTCVACGWLNVFSSLFRFASSDSLVPQNYRYPLAISGQFFGAVAQPLAMFSPAKLASMWFSPDQRAVATTIGAMGNPLGILVGSVLPPYLVAVPSSKHSGGLFAISTVIVVISLVSALLPTLGMYQSAPVFPPPASAERHCEEYSFVEQLRLCLSNVAFVKLCVAFGVGLGLFTALSTLFEQIFCPFGYSDSFAGTCGAVLIGAGIMGSFFSGMIADKTKALVEVVQACLVSATFGTIAFTMLADNTDFSVGILLGVAWVGAFGVALYSVALELAAEMTFPVSENASTGLLVVAGQIFSVAFIGLSACLWQRQDIDVPMQCVSGGAGTNSSNGNGSGPIRNYWPFNVFLSAVAIGSCCLLLLGFAPKYNRRIMETAHGSAHDSFGTDVEASLTQ